MADVVTYDDWGPEPATISRYRTVVDAAVHKVKRAPGEIIQVRTYKDLSAAKRGLKTLEKARSKHPSPLPEGDWQWKVRTLEASVKTEEGDEHIAEIRLCWTPPPAQVSQP